MNPALRAFADDYLAEMLTGNAAVFAGAGLSMPAGYVDWKNLIRPLSREIDLDIDLEHDLIAVAQFHVNANGQSRHRLHKAIIDALSPDRPPADNHDILAQLPIQTWWTTNYDKLLENAFRNHDKVVDIKISVPQLANTRPNRDVTLYKMHGDVDRPDEAVVTRDDYEKYSKSRAPFINALMGDLISKTFLFIGFSFNDPNLQHVLSQLRYHFADNQRRHYAIFKDRSKLENETNQEFTHHKARQSLVIEDLKRYNIKVLIVDDYSDITKILRVMLNEYKRRTVFISGSVADFQPWGEEAVRQFGQSLGEKLVQIGARIATGLGAGFGDAVFTGALREVHRVKAKIEDQLVLRPFPQGIVGDERASAWRDYRVEMISQAGIAVFLFGNRLSGDHFQFSEGVAEEFDIARNQGCVVLPIGGTGSMSGQLAEQFLNQESVRPKLSKEARDLLQFLAKDIADLETSVPQIIKLVQMVQSGVSE